jgi:hypothetical protein
MLAAFVYVHSIAVDRFSLSATRPQTCLVCVEEQQLQLLAYCRIDPEHLKSIHWPDNH